jgi:hypothetical protein
MKGLDGPEVFLNSGKSFALAFIFYWFHDLLFAQPSFESK